MGLLDALFNQVSQTITNHSSPNTPGPAYDPSDLLSQLSGIFGQHAANNNEDFSGYGNVRPASEDPYGDPADQGQFGNVLPSSQDPYGDPADQSNQGQFGNIRPASEDPYGDPADQR
jgi:hypothetical protein